jgi:hypothetical protein
MDDCKEVKMKRIIFWACFLCFAFLTAASLSAQDQKPVEPVNWRQLTPLLIDIQGYEGAEPEGSTTSMAQFKMSQASREYTKGENSIKIEIIDGSYIPMAYASYKILENFEVDSSEELVRKVTIQGFPAIENIHYKDKEASLSIMVGERFLVNIRGEKFDKSDELKDIANRLDLKKLASMK